MKPLVRHLSLAILLTSSIACSSDPQSTNTNSNAPPGSEQDNSTSPSKMMSWGEVVQTPDVTTCIDFSKMRIEREFTYPGSILEVSFGCALPSNGLEVVFGQDKPTFAHVSSSTISVVVPTNTSPGSYELLVQAGTLQNAVIVEIASAPAAPSDARSYLSEAIEIQRSRATRITDQELRTWSEGVLDGAAADLQNLDEAELREAARMLKANEQALGLGDTTRSGGNIWLNSSMRCQIQGSTPERWWDCFRNQVVQSIRYGIASAAVATIGLSSSSTGIGALIGGIGLVGVTYNLLDIADDVIAITSAYFYVGVIEPLVNSTSNIASGSQLQIAATGSYANLFGATPDEYATSVVEVLAVLSDLRALVAKLDTILPKPLNVLPQASASSTTLDVDSMYLSLGLPENYDLPDGVTVSFTGLSARPSNMTDSAVTVTLELTYDFPEVSRKSSIFQVTILPSKRGCGDENQECCAEGPACNSPELACESGTCRSMISMNCGQEGAECCPSGPACLDGLTCLDGLECVAQAPCGGRSQECCDGTTCDAGLSCSDNSICEPQQTPCDGNADGAADTFCSAFQVCGNRNGQDYCWPETHIPCDGNNDGTEDTLCAPGNECLIGEMGEDKCFPAGTTNCDANNDGTFRACDYLETCYVNAGNDHCGFIEHGVGCDGNGDGSTDTRCAHSAEVCFALNGQDACAPRGSIPCDANGDGVFNAACTPARPNCVALASNPNDPNSATKDECLLPSETPCDGDGNGVATLACNSNTPTCVEQRNFARKETCLRLNQQVCGCGNADTNCHIDNSCVCQTSGNQDIPGCDGPNSQSELDYLITCVHPTNGVEYTCQNEKPGCGYVDGNYTCLRPEEAECDANNDGNAEAACNTLDEQCAFVNGKDACIGLFDVPCDANNDGNAETACDGDAQACVFYYDRDFCVPAGIEVCNQDPNSRFTLCAVGRCTPDNRCMLPNQELCDGNQDGNPEAICDSTRPTCVNFNGSDQCIELGFTPCDMDQDGVVEQQCTQGTSCFFNEDQKKTVCR